MSVHGAICALNRPQFVNLAADWLGAIPEVDAPACAAARPHRRSRVRNGLVEHRDRARVPEVTVDAIDVDAESIEAARANVAAAGLSDRVRPAVYDASDVELDGRYDLVTIFEALHDMNHPVEALRTARNSLAGGGSVVVADERVAERFTAPGDELERLGRPHVCFVR